MKKKTLLMLITSLLVFIFCTSLLTAQEEDKQKEEVKEAYQFTLDVELPHTPPVSQGRTGTCWCFATNSMLESEFMRNNKKDTLNLSEMFIVRHAYTDKAENYIRFHGKINFAQGGACHDVIDQMEQHGCVPEIVYTGKNIGEDDHNHSEIGRVLNAMVDAVLEARRPTPIWKDAFNAAADVYLGTPPETFTHNDKKFTPKTFLKNYLDLDPDDYIEITSFSHLPLYQQVMLRLPDNWTFNDEYYNVKVEDLSRIIEHSLKEGHTVVYGGDVSNRHFSSRNNGYAIVPKDEKWEDKSLDEIEAEVEEPVEEKEITAELRQKQFDKFLVTDDHAMHIVGLAYDQKGNSYFYTKNSWGTKGKYNGYLYMSKPFVELSITAIMVNKHALPKDIKKKLGL
ncbi:MAG: C1 family peptidase [bacterium]